MQTFTLDSLAQLELLNLCGELVTYRGRCAFWLVEEEVMSDGGGTVCQWGGTALRDGQRFLTWRIT